MKERAAELAYKALERSDKEGTEPAPWIMQALGFTLPQDKGITHLAEMIADQGAILTDL